MKTRRFTMIEILAVMIIILILASMVAGAAAFARAKARRDRTIAQIKTLEVALGQYNSDWGFYPQSASPAAMSATFWNGLVDTRGRAYISIATTGFAYDDSDGSGQRDAGEPVYDPYGNPFFYECPGTMNDQMYDLWSMGADGGHGAGASGTPSDAQSQSTATVNCDDITNWKRN